MTATIGNTMANSLEEQIKEAHVKIAEWERTTFYLGSAFNHCAKLESFAGPELKEALEQRKVVIDMPSEYHAPRFRIVEKQL